jgi:hypothetical protein
VSLTSKQFRAWKVSRNAGISSAFIESANEAWNESIGLPRPEIRRKLLALHLSRFGSHGDGELTYAEALREVKGGAE